MRLQELVGPLDIFHGCSENGSLGLLILVQKIQILAQNGDTHGEDITVSSRLCGQPLEELLVSPGTREEGLWGRVLDQLLDMSDTRPQLILLVGGDSFSQESLGFLDQGKPFLKSLEIAVCYSVFQRSKTTLDSLADTVPWHGETLLCRNLNSITFSENRRILASASSVGIPA